MKPGKKKLIKRKPKGGASPKDFYFNADTQQAILEYKAETDKNKRNEIYMKAILPAFSKLVENLINVYGFQVQFESKSDLQSECVEFLYGVIDKFDLSKGARAFAYFNVVAKHWLIIKSKQSTRNNQLFTSLDDREKLSAHDLELIENHDVDPSPEEAMIMVENGKRLKFLLSRVEELAATENEAAAMKGILMLFDNINDLDFFNKRAVMLYLREITELPPKALSVVLSTMKKYYKQAKDEYDELDKQQLDGRTNQ